MVCGMALASVSNGSGALGESGLGFGGVFLGSEGHPKLGVRP